MARVSSALPTTTYPLAGDYNYTFEYRGTSGAIRDGFRTLVPWIDWRRRVGSHNGTGSGMGVRFECPNGHKLHVKAELAGKRGICPECGVKFVVPSFSGERVAEAAAEAPLTATPTPTPSGAASSGSVVIQTAPPSGIARSAASENSQPPTVAVAWYIRPAAGGQFGPASTEVFQKWIAEGRVTADSWVWRTGWADWKPGTEAIALLSDRPPLGPAAAMTGAIDPLLDHDVLSTTGPVESGTAQARRAEIRRRKQRTRTISVILGMVALAVLVVLVVVLAR
jgi:hypothetical protein